ncbi:hypothetical protein O9992_12235 [Vibrio lentus]|nr:hypothetical protein [Vibrio lentus]
MTDVPWSDRVPLMVVTSSYHLSFMKWRLVLLFFILNCGSSKAASSGFCIRVIPSRMVHSASWLVEYVREPDAQLYNTGGFISMGQIYHLPMVISRC